MTLIMLDAHLQCWQKTIFQQHTQRHEEAIQLHHRIDHDDVLHSHTKTHGVNSRTERGRTEETEN